MPPILCLGLNHHTAPVALRERLSCSLAPITAQLPADTAVLELAVLATCNRVELYAVIQPHVPAPKLLLLNLLAQANQVDPAEFMEYVYFMTGDTAVNHLLRVAAGLESLVLGEPQILGQVTNAYMTAVNQHTIGPVINALFKTAIRAGKRARAETTISSNPASVSSVAIALAQQTLGPLDHRQILVIGAGQMGRLALKALRQRGLGHIAVANRTVARAQALTAAWGGAAYGLDELPAAIANADVVITAVSSSQPLIDSSTIAPRARPLVIVDIAVPRNVDTAVATLPHVRLYDVDDLQATLDESLAARQAEIPRVDQIITEETGLFATQLGELAVKPLIRDMRRKAEQIRETELERTMRHLGDLDAQTAAHIKHLSQSIVNKLLHEPTLLLKQKASNNQADAYATAVRELFGLPE